MTLIIISHVVSSVLAVRGRVIYDVLILETYSNGKIFKRKDRNLLFVVDATAARLLLDLNIKILVKIITVSIFCCVLV